MGETTPNQTPSKTEKKSLGMLIGAMVIISIIAGIFIVVVSYAQRSILKPASPQAPQTIVLTPPSCAQDFADYQALANRQSIDLVQGFHAYAANGDFAQPNKLVNIVRTGTDEIACGYLYVKATKDDTSVDKIDHIYINPNGFGGHIVASNSITLGTGTLATDTIEFLLPLNAITYLPDKHSYIPNANDNRIANWVNLLNVGNLTVFEINSDIQNSAAVIDDIKIAYKCWNPNDTQNSGKETNNCSLGTQ